MGRASLVIMAAGLGSRYKGIKQLERVGPSGENIMDYSIYDALEAGFDKVVFIIRKDIAQEFSETIGNRIAKKVETQYVFQEMDSLPDGFRMPEGRTKPWGTGHAVFCCRHQVAEPFLVINADDYYGRESFVKVFEHLDSMQGGGRYCMAGFVLGNTLSDHGTVTRGVCRTDQAGMLTGIEETFSISRMGQEAAGMTQDGRDVLLALDSLVSMNMWGFGPDFFQVLTEGFLDFLRGPQAFSEEYMLPSAVGRALMAGHASVKVLRTQERWFGVTYQEDKQAVVWAVQKLIDEGRYPGSIL